MLNKMLQDRMAWGRTIPGSAITLYAFYLKAGLQPEPALRAALADFFCGFSETERRYGTDGIANGRR